MKILFVLFYPGFLRYYDSTIRLLAERGHTVDVAFSIPEKQSEGILGLAGAGERVSVLGPLPKRQGVWSIITRDIRGTLDYARYLHPRFADSDYLRTRMEKFLPGYARGLIRVPRLQLWQLRPFLGALHALERAIPSDPAMEAYIEASDPDVVVVTPLVNPASQTDIIKSAQALGIRTSAAIASWDNLTTKGLLRIQPDSIIVWNEIQRTEAVELHGAKPESVCVTGAQPYDRWFERRPSTSREAFCAKVGLPPDKPFVLFVGSTASISAPDAEHQFVRSWIGALRSSGNPVVADLGVLIRPHPYNSVQWSQTDVSDLADVAVWPRHGANPVDENDRADYFDSLYHSVAVVGINTSAMIEAAIVGRPVHTVVGEEFADTQGGTIHFHYMLPEHGGFVRVARGLEDHVRKLAETIEHPEIVQQDIRRFLESFVRPNGLDVPCTPLVADEIERLAALGPAPLSAPSAGLRALRSALYLAALVRTAQVRARKVFRVRKRLSKRLQLVRKRLRKGRSRLIAGLPLSEAQRRQLRRVRAALRRDSGAGALGSANGSAPAPAASPNGHAVNGTAQAPSERNGLAAGAGADRPASGAGGRAT